MTLKELASIHLIVDIVLLQQNSNLKGNIFKAANFQDIKMDNRYFREDKHAKGIIRSICLFVFKTR